VKVVIPSPTPTPAQRLAERRLRVRTIRRRAAGLAAGTFLAASGGILVQLVTGHDPALARESASSTSAATSAAAASATVAATPTPLTTSAS
jgi:hypothetical protein